MIFIFPRPKPSSTVHRCRTATERRRQVANRPDNVVGEGDLGWSEQRHGERFGHRRKQLASASGGRKVGCSFYEVEPGRAAFPRHYHLANEAAIYVLEGSGILRLGAEGEQFPLARGDYVALPPGAEGAHQLVNTSDGILRYLCLSTVAEPDVLVYPDSGKVGVYVGEAGARRRERSSPSSYGTAPRG
jgi:uncharacterized cupin superfamily protein